MKGDGSGIEPIPGSPQELEYKDKISKTIGGLNETERLLSNIDELLNHEGFGGSVGAWNYTRLVPGTSAAGFAGKLETLKAQTFLPMVEKMKGMGHLSDMEGKRITDAVGALNYNMPEGEFRKELVKVKTMFQQARDRQAKDSQRIYGRQSGDATRNRGSVGETERIWYREKPQRSNDCYG